MFKTHTPWWQKVGFCMILRHGNGNAFWVSFAWLHTKISKQTTACIGVFALSKPLCAVCKQALAMQCKNLAKNNPPTGIFRWGFQYCFGATWWRFQAVVSVF